MAFNVGQLEIQLIADVARLQRDMDKMQSTVSRSTRRINKSVGSSISAFKGLIGVVGAAGVGRAILRATDEYTKYSAQLRLATGNQEEFTQALKDSRRIAAAAQSDLSSVAVLYARLANNLRDAKVAQSDISRITETVALALKAQGASAAESSSAMLQLSQAFGKGRLDGQELNAMLESSPSLMRALAKSINVPFGALKDLGAEGKLTAEVMTKAFTDDALLEAYRTQAKEVRTISGAWQVFKNDLTLVIGEMNKTSGTADLVMEALKGLSAVVAFLADAFVAAIATIKQFGRSLAVVFNDLKTMGELWFQLLDPASLFTDKGGIKRILNEHKLFTQAANEDLEKYLTTPYTKFRDLLSDIEGKLGTGGGGSFGSVSGGDSTGKLSDIGKQKLKELQKLLDLELKLEDKKKKAAAKSREEERQAQIESDKKLMAWRQKQANENFQAAQKAHKDFENQRRRDYERTGDVLSRSLTDALFRGFESGKSFVENFIDTLKNTFKTLVLQPIVRFLVDSSGITAALGAIGGLFSGNAQAGALGTGPNSITGLLGDIKGLFQSGNNSFIGAINDFGAFLANGKGGILDSIGGFIGQYSSQIADVLPYAGAALSLLTGDIKGAAFSGAGTAIGSFFGGPIGGAIGGALGSVAGGLFGGKDQPPRAGGSNRTFLGADGSVSNRFLGGVEDYSSAVQGSVKGATKYVANALKLLNEGFGGLDDVSVQARYYGREGGSSYQDFSARVGDNRFNIPLYRNKDAFGEADFKSFLGKVQGEFLAKTITRLDLPEGVKSFFTGLKSGVAETIQSLVSMHNALKDLPPVFDNVREVLDKNSFGLKLNELQAQFQATQQFYQLFYSEAEQFDVFTKQITRSLDDLNVALPSSRDEYRALVDAFDVVDKATSDQFTALTALAPAMDAYFNGLNNQKDALEDLADALDPERFSTYADFVSAQATIGAGGDASGFMARINNPVAMNQVMAEEIKMLRAENAETKVILEKIAFNTAYTARTNKQWNGDGLPAERTY